MENWDGTFDLVDPREIQFDRVKYQRVEHWPLIGRIASSPNWIAFGVIPCAKREYAGGTLWALDGQQRLLGVLSSQVPPKLVPIVWWTVKSRAEEAARFIEINVNRKTVTPLARFKAHVGSENQASMIISGIVADCGFDIAASGDSAKAIAAVGALGKILGSAGEAGVRVALEGVREEWADERHATSAAMLSLFADVLGEMASSAGIQPDKFHAGLRRTSPGHLTRRAKDIRHDTDCSMRIAYRRAFKALAKV